MQLSPLRIQSINQPAQYFHMQKIHRRKNEQITKQFVCTEGCGKAYGSYAALYTHVKNKHSYAKLPEMKAGLIKPKQGETNKKTQVPQRDSLPVDTITYPYDCKICKKIECICDEQINTEELDRAINVMADQTYIKFINFIGGLHYNEKASWIRNTEDSFDFYNKEKLREMVYQFNVKYSGIRENQVMLSAKWLDYLSYTSRVIDRKSIIELYNSIFMILSKENLKDIENVFNDFPQFQTIRRCIEARQKEWNDFMEFIKVI